MAFFENWKTTLGGLGAVFGALADIAHQLSTGSIDPNNIYLDVTALAGGVGLIYAQDAQKKSS